MKRIARTETKIELKVLNSSDVGIPQNYVCQDKCLKLFKNLMLQQFSIQLLSD